MRFVSLTLLLASMAAGADPISIKVKEGVLVRPDESTVTVDAGIYLNEEGRLAVMADIAKMEEANLNLTLALQRANQTIKDCSGYVPGLPGWAYAAISIGLTALTGLATYFAIAGSK